ncbi:MAG: hypothetical protein GKS03_14340 [Alphaproteobacteria bacterium]|nr:hypothetical protein [Alphaproteobacteria bacterium]
MKRRTALGLLGVAAGFPTIIGSKSARAAGLLDPSKPEDLHTIHRKLNFSMDEKPVFWFIEATRFGLKDYEFTPFWKMHVGMVFKVKDIGERLYESSHMIKIFYSDLETGKLLETFHNPYTGQKRPVQQPGVARSKRKHGLTGVISDAQPREGVGAVTSNNEIGPAWVINDDVWCNGDLVVKAEKPNNLDMTIHVNDWSTYHGSISEVSDPDVISASATHTFNDINTFNHPWIGMQGVTANSVSRGFGRKSRSIEGMPPAWRGFMAEHNPDILADIDGAIEG